MRDLIAFITIVVVTGVLYWGVEPFAHSVMSPHVASADFNFANEDINLAKKEVEEAQNALNEQSDADEATKNNLQKLLNNAKANLESYTAFWNDINSINLKNGDPKKGEELLAMAGCTGCHGIQKIGMPEPMDAKTASEAYGVTPPDLSNIGYLYDEKFLAALIKDPVKALKVGHKFGDENPFPMTSFFGVGGDINQEIADLVAYFKSIAPKEMTNKDAFVASCGRCHDMKYDEFYISGNKQSLATYLGTTPPDLSMYIRSRSKTYLHNFINDTQKMLPGTSMPRVGLNEKTQNQVVAYMEEIGDSKKQERENLGLWLMGYFLILGIFATLWKMKIWRNLH